MKKLLLTVSTLIVLSGCASLPQESVIAQEKIGSGIETARINQLLLIDKFAEQEKQRIRLAAKIAIPAALAKKYPGKFSYTQPEVEALLAEYGADMEAQLQKIDNKRIQLARDTNQFFDDLGSINSLNLELIKSVVDLNRMYKAAFDQVKDKAKTKLPEILSQ